MNYLMIHGNCRMEQDNLDIGEQNALEEEMEEHLKKEESAKKLQAILFVMLPILVTFLIGGVE